MRKKSFVIIALIALLTVNACKKNDNPQPTIMREMVYTVHSDAEDVGLAEDINIDTIEGLVGFPDLDFIPTDYYSTWVFDNDSWNIVMHLDEVHQRGMTSMPMYINCTSQFYLGGFTYETIDTTLAGVSGEQVLHLHFYDLLPVDALYGVSASPSSMTWWPENSGCADEYTFTKIQILP